MLFTYTRDTHSLLDFHSKMATNPLRQPVFKRQTKAAMCDKNSDIMIAHAQSQPIPSRRLRPVERQPMREWLLELLDSNQVSSLSWLDKAKREFRIKWCHGSRHGWSLKDADLFERWARHTGRYLFGGKEDPKRWKANFRCALNSLKTIEEIRDKSYVKGSNACRIYRIKDNTRKETKIQARRAQKNNEQYQTQGLHQQREVKHEEAHVEHAMVIQDDCVVEEEKTDMKPPSVQLTPFTEAKGERKSFLPNFDKISPGIDRIEFGKMHSIPYHSCGFTVKMVTPSSSNSNASSSSTSHSLPALSNIKISLPESFQAQIVATSCIKPITTIPAPQQYQSYAFPESPEASDASPQSAVQDEEMVEINLVEVSQEVTISSQGTEESQFPMMDLTPWQQIDDQYQAEIVNILAATDKSNININNSTNGWPHGYSPLTPP